MAYLPWMRVSQEEWQRTASAVHILLQDLLL